MLKCYEKTRNKVSTSAAKAITATKSATGVDQPPNSTNSQTTQCKTYLVKGNKKIFLK